MASGRVRYFNVYQHGDGRVTYGSMLESRAACDAMARAIGSRYRVYVIRVTYK